MRYIILSAIIILIILFVYPYYSMMKIRSAKSHHHSVPKDSWGQIELNLFNYVKHLSNNIGSRSFFEPSKIGDSRDFIVKQLKDFGLSPTIQNFTVDNRKFSNIVITVTGQNYAEEIVVIGAHYDTVLGTPGADDNGSGVAMLLEMARILGSSNPDRTLKLVFFVLEEPPIFGTKNMGSRVFARRAKKADMDIRAMISLEMVGYFSKKNGKQAFPLPLMNLFYSTTPDFIAVVGNLQSRALVKQTEKGLRAGCLVPVETLAAPAFVPGVGFSDHASFWKEDYPAVMITDTAFYRNPNYHQPTDTYDTLSYETMAELVKGLVHTAEDLCKV